MMINAIKIILTTIVIAFRWKTQKEEINHKISCCVVVVVGELLFSILSQISVGLSRIKSNLNTMKLYTKCS